MYRLISLLFCMGAAFGAELIIDTDSTLVEGGTYDRIEITARNVTLRNVTVRNTTGENYYAGIYVNGAKYATVENCIVDGGAVDKSGPGTCGGIKLNGASRAMIRNNKIYNLNDDGIRMYSSSLSDIIGNEIYRLFSCGRESENETGCSQCINGHSDGLQLIYCTKVNVIGNFVYDVRGNAALMMGNNVNQSCRFITMANNMFYTPEAGYTAYLHYSQDFDLVNNVILGGIFGSIWYGPELYSFRMQNNICGMHKLKGGGTYDASQHTVTHNLYCELHPYFNIGIDNIIERDPQFTVADWDGSDRTPEISDFAIKSTSPCRDAGASAAYIPELDIYDKTRSGAPDIGVIEYGGVSDIILYSTQPEPEGLAVTAEPNPMIDHITITVKNKTPHPSFAEATQGRRGVSTVSVYDQSGNAIHTASGISIRWDGKTISGSTAKPGMYFYRITAGDQAVSGRIIKTR